MIDFNQMIDNYLYREFVPKKFGKYYPSEIGQCLRKLWYSYKYPLSVEPNLIKIFEVGNILHDFVVKVLKSERNPHVELLKYEFPVQITMDDFVVKGRIDDLVLVKEDGKQLLVEVKSCRNADSITEPMDHHMTQLQFYMSATGVKDGLLLYVDKNTLQTSAFDVPFDENFNSEILERFKILHAFLVKNVLPAAEAKLNKRMNWMCRFCEYRSKCDKNES